MANWLESEENKKLDKDKERELILQMQERVHNDLKRFYELCDRVNKVKPHSLSVYRLGVSGNKRSDTEKYGFGSGSREVYNNRGIVFNCSNIERLMINVYLLEHHWEAGIYLGGRWIDGEYFEPISSDSKSYTEQKEILHKRFLPEDIINWTEEDMLITIEYLLRETEYINLPGNEMSEEQKNIKLNDLRNQLRVAKSNLLIINGFKIGRTKKEKEIEVKTQNENIKKLHLDIINIQKELLT